ncbi:N-acetyltransferase [Porphyrobacter sp. TH134]|uniref:GNAT family N-acetyltransferase n=1 Tax=Porphyrobacter sp. TH134 TaxID=2067450 RepID=UPI000C7B39E2|nr:GNAT family N-acetyltransferase [Porphyrobacter sp. TH134]PLK23726.1 N-acetyltransferase [Porphyrobacter sp. TH134]
MMIAPADLDDGQVQWLIAYHQQAMLAGSPAGHSFALDLSALRDPAISVWDARIDGMVVGIGAMKRLEDGAAEIKSMRTHPDFLRRGIAARLLDTMIDHARSLGVTRLSLETGSGPAFEPALALYRNRGFANGAAFGEYRLSAFNQCLHLALD